MGSAFDSTPPQAGIKTANNFTFGADIVKYMNNRIKHVPELISFLVKLNMA